MNLDQIEEKARGMASQVRNNPGVAIVLLAVVIVLGVIVVYEINRSLTYDERVLYALSQAKDLSDYDELITEHKGGHLESLIMLEKLFFLANGNEDHKPDFEKAKILMDELYNEEKTDLITSDLIVVYGTMIAPQISTNLKFEKEYAAARKAAAAKKTDAQPEEAPVNPEETPKDTGGTEPSGE